MTTVEEKLGLDKYELDEESHIVVDQSICSACPTQYCLTVCPAKVYLQEEEAGSIVVNHAGCLECGTCVAACIPKGLDWRLPASAMGVVFRYA